MLNQILRNEGRGMKMEKSAQEHLLKLHKRIEKCEKFNYSKLKYINSSDILGEIVTRASGFAMKFGWSKNKIVFKADRKRISLKDVKYVIKEDMNELMKMLKRCSSKSASLK